MPNLFDLPRPFFPNPVFAWVWVALLLGQLGVIAAIDTRRAIIPNKLVLPLFILGLVVNVVRGAWQAAVGHPSWLFGNTDNPWLGGLDGFLFGLVGFAVAFGVFFACWMFKLLKAGDVKLFAAVGAWLGLIHLVFAWMLSTFALVLWAIYLAMSKGLKPSQVQSSLKKLQKSGKETEQGAGRGDGRKLGITYSLPIAVAVAALSLWSHRVELLLSSPKPVPNTGANTNDPPPSEPK